MNHLSFLTSLFYQDHWAAGPLITSQLMTCDGWIRLFRNLCTQWAQEQQLQKYNMVDHGWSWIFWQEELIGNLLTKNPTMKDPSLLLCLRGTSLTLTFAVLAVTVLERNLAKAEDITTANVPTTFLTTVNVKMCNKANNDVAQLSLVHQPPIFFWPHHFSKVNIDTILPQEEQHCILPSSLPKLHIEYSWQAEKS
jgi:hypothetical protein